MTAHTSRTFLYARVSTVDRSTNNQLLLAKQAGYEIEPKRVRAETISGTIPATERPVFAKLVSALEEDDTLVVAKLDRLVGMPQILTARSRCCGSWASGSWYLICR